MSVRWLEVEDLYPHENVRRYSGIKPLHEGIRAVLRAHEAGYEAFSHAAIPYLTELRDAIAAADPNDVAMPRWENPFFPPLDMVASYALISRVRPTRYVEIGSGTSTKVAALACRTHSPKTRIISIDPEPRAEIDALCSKVYRWSDSSVNEAEEVK